jgi:carboxylate-amine ligase
VRVERRAHGAEVGVTTVGVEEELTLLDPGDGSVATTADAVIEECREPGLVVAESMRFLVETRTPVCATLDEVHAAVLAGRLRVASVAARHGAVAVATGLAPFGFPDPPPVTDDPRYLELARRFPRAMGTNGFAGCHVHVGVPDRGVAVEAPLRLRPWLPPLVALMANSPIWRGEDAGWASRRLLLAARWPTVVPPPPVRSEEDYDGSVARAVARGQALDSRSVYYLARLSPRYPTIEVRAADMGLTAAETTAYAGLVRALVRTAVREGEDGGPVEPAPWLRRSCRDAARVGLRGLVSDPRTGRPVPAGGLVDELLERVLPELSVLGDEAVVVPGVEALRRTGGGAERQRQLFARSGSPGDFAAALARETLGPHA